MEDSGEEILLYLGPAHGTVCHLGRSGAHFFNVPNDGKVAEYTRTEFSNQSGRRVYIYTGAKSAAIRGEIQHADIHSLFPENRIVLYVALDPGIVSHRAVNEWRNRRVRLIVEDEASDPTGGHIGYLARRALAPAFTDPPKESSTAIGAEPAACPGRPATSLVTFGPDGNPVKVETPCPVTTTRLSTCADECDGCIICGEDVLNEPDDPPADEGSWRERPSLL